MPYCEQDELVYERFRRAAAAPLASPRVCNPGPGGLVLVQTAGEFSASGTRLEFAAPGTPAWGGQSARISRHDLSDTGIVARASERALVACFDLADAGDGTGGKFGFWPSATLDASIEAGPAIVWNDSLGDNAAFWRATTYSSRSASSKWFVGVVPRAAGGWFGAVAVPDVGLGWTIFHLDFAGSSANLYAGWSNFDGAGALSRFYLTRQSCAPAALVDVASPVSGTEYAGVPNVLLDVGITQGGSLVDGHRAEVRFKYRDSRNFWAVGTVVDTTANLYIDRVVDGVRTTAADAADIAAAGATVYVQITSFVVEGICNVDIRTRATRTATSGWTQQMQAMEEDTTGTKIVPFVSGTGSLANLLAYPSACPIPGAV